MKKRICLLIIILFLPIIVNAKEYCEVISGNGKDIGSEIACGTEHFYVIENKDNNLKLLSKYNLYVGANYNKINLDINEIYIKSECIDGECGNNEEYYFEGEQLNTYGEWYNRIKEKYNINDIINTNDQTWFDIYSKPIAIYLDVYGDKYSLNGKTYQNRTYKLYPVDIIDYDNEKYALQNSLALGVTGEKGKANYPIYATTIILPGPTDQNHIPEIVNTLDNFENGYLNFDFTDKSIIKNYLIDYKSKLNSKGFEISNVDLISIKEIKDLVYSISNKNLPLSEWYNNSINSNIIEEDGTKYHELGDLKQYVPNDYSWIWGTSYWTKTLVGNDQNNYNQYEAYFISSQGEICYSYAECFAGIPRAGVRPVIGISKDSIKYIIKTKTDGKGTIEVVDSAYGGETISFRVSTKKGYKLGSLTIITDTGESITYNEDNITNNPDGTISISTNKFTMPYENITIQARWVSTIINPITISVIGIIVFDVVIILGLYIYIKKYLNKHKMTK